MAEFKYAFISHRNVEPDLSVTKRMSKYLEDEKHLGIWFDDRLETDDTWAAQISKKLDNASVYILVASEHSLSPALQVKQIERELGNIMKQCDIYKKKLIPFVIDDYYFNMESGTTKYFLGGNLEQAVILSKFPTEEAAFEKLAEYLKIHLDCYENSISDFDFDDNKTLKRYNGKDTFVTIPDFIVKIDENAFLNNSTLEKVKILPNVKIISKRAFMGCSNLTEVLGMEGVENCDPSAFNRTAVYIGPENNYMLNGVVFGGDVVDGVLTLPPKTRVIARSAFPCTDAKVINLPEGLEHIGLRAFHDSCFVEEIIIPSTVKTIGDKAFEGCSKLKRVVFKGEIPEGVTNAFPQHTEITKEN